MNDRISQVDLDATTRYALHIQLESMPKHNVVCHGDFNPSNIILSDNHDHQPYIVDWSQAAQGHPWADAAKTYLYFWLTGNTTQADQYLDLFCQKSGAQKHDVQKWFPFVAAAYPQQSKPRMREFLLSWLNIAQIN